jgi:hypothetical protein
MIKGIIRYENAARHFAKTGVNQTAVKIGEFLDLGPSLTMPLRHATEQRFRSSQMPP